MDTELNISEMVILQEEVSCLNDVALEDLSHGNLKSAVEHLHQALARLKVIAKMKHCFQMTTARDLDAKSVRFEKIFLKPPIIQRSGEPLPIDVASSVSSTHWETIASVALMHNASLVHFKGGRFSQSKGMLDLARGLLKTKLNENNMLEVLNQSKYAVSVVISMYILYGRVILKLPDGDHVQATQAFKMASILMIQFESSRNSGRSSQIMEVEKHKISDLEILAKNNQKMSRYGSLNENLFSSGARFSLEAVEEDEAHHAKKKTHDDVCFSDPVDHFFYPIITEPWDCPDSFTCL